MRINAHSHLLPYPEQIPDLMQSKKVFWVDEARKFMYQNDWKRPITDASFFLEEKLEWMHQFSIDHAVVLNLSQLYGNGLAAEDRRLALKFQNDFNASVQQKYGQKFTCGFVVNPIDMDEALEEIRRAVEELNLRVLCLPTHYLGKTGEWKTVFNDDNKPLFELANDYGLAIEIHPYDGEKFIHLANDSWRFHLIWMLAQCADAYHYLTLDSYYQDYPNVRFCFAHGGQLAQMNLGRRIQGFDGRPDLFEGKAHPRRAVGHQNIFFDTLLHDTGSFELLIKNQGVGQILVGLDDPYPLGEMNNEAQSSYPGKILDLAVAEKLIREEDVAKMWHNNVLKWLYGQDKSLLVDFQNRVKN